MLSSVKLIVFPMILMLEINAIVLESLPEIVRNHSNILNEFEPYLEKTTSLENHISSLEPNVTVVADHIGNLKKELANLTAVSVAYTEKLNSFEEYQNKTDKLQEHVSELLKTVRTYDGYVKELEQYKASTNVLEKTVTQIKSDVENSKNETRVISESVNSFYQTCQANQNEAKQKLTKVDAMEKQEREIAKKFQDILKAVGVERKSSLENITSLQQTCIAEQRKIKTKLDNLNDLPISQAETTKKLNDLVSQVNKQNGAVTKNIESLKISVNKEQNIVKKELQKLNPLSNAQEETAKKLKDFSNLFNEVKNKQQTLQASLVQLNNQLQEFITSHTTTSTTPPPTTPDPGRAPVVIRRRVHARGNNIIIQI